MASLGKKNLVAWVFFFIATVDKRSTIKIAVVVKIYTCIVLFLIFKVSYIYIFIYPIHHYAWIHSYSRIFGW